MPLLHRATRPLRPRPGRRLAVGAGAALLVAVSILAGSNAFASGAPTELRVGNPGSSSTTPASNPPASVPPSAAFLEYCRGTAQIPSCNTAALADINRARRAEHLGRLALPATFWSAGTTEQLRIITNLERHSRGLPALTLNSTLTAIAQTSAKRGVEPTGPADTTWRANISWGYGTPLAADFAWMYDVGPRSPNVACTSAHAPGCWGHRDNILSPWSGSSGLGAFDNRGSEQFTQLFVERR